MCSSTQVAVHSCGGALHAHQVRPLLLPYYARPPSPPAGVQLPLPAGYSGAVLERRQAEESDTAGSPGGGGAQGERWAATATFPTHMHYWNHDAAPLRGDGLRRCMEWAGLAERLHAPVDPAAVGAAAAAGSGAALQDG